MKTISTEGPLGTCTRYYEDVDSFSNMDFNIFYRTSDENTFIVESVDEDITFSAEKQLQKTTSFNNASALSNHQIIVIAFVIGFQIIGGVGAETIKLVKPGEQVTLGLPFGDGHSCPEEHIHWYFTPPNEKEICTCAGRECLENDIYAVNHRCQLCFTAAKRTVGRYRQNDDDQQHVDLYEASVALDDSPKSGASGLRTCQLPSLLLIVTMIVMIMHWF